MPSGALIGSAVIGGAASIFGASKGAAATKYAAKLTAETTRETNALNERIYNQTRTDNEPFRNLGVSAAGAVGSAFGLPGYGSTPSMTAPAAPRTYAASAPGGGVSMTGTRSAEDTAARNALRTDAPDPRAAWNANHSAKTEVPKGGFAGTSPLEGAPSGQPQTGAPDWDAYLATNPDVAAEAQRVGMDPQDYAAYHYQTFGKGEGRDLTTVAAPAPPPNDGSYQPAPGYTDPTAPSGYMTGDRPDLGPGPSPYAAPVRMTGPALDVGIDKFRASPDYQFRFDQGNLALDHAAAAGGGLMSGARQKAAIRFGQNIADGEYTDWRNYTTGQFNVDRSRGDAIYSEDRGFGYGQARDARGDFTQDRSRSDGLYGDDRSRNDARYDTRNNQLLSMAGFGTAANASNTSAANTFASNTTAANTAAANARGNAAIQGANAWSAAADGIASSTAYLAGKYFDGKTGGGNSYGGLSNPYPMTSRGM